MQRPHQWTPGRRLDDPPAACGAAHAAPVSDSRRFNTADAHDAAIMGKERLFALQQRGSQTLEPNL